jgi:glycosyltransferase involved in cell wall biosynthesis
MAAGGLPADVAPQPSGAPLVSVVIPTRDRPAFVHEALECLIAGECGRFEALVMDQSDGEATHDVVRGLADPRIVYHRMSRPGACPARNLGAALAQAPLVAFLDDDCHPRPDWLARIVQAFEADPELEFIFGQLSAPPEVQTEGIYPYFLPTPDLTRPRNHRRVLKDAAGANMSCRKEFLLRFGGFDELLGPAHPGVAGNDTSIIYKVLRSGRKWTARADIDVVHANGFRNWEQWERLTGRYAHGSGVNYGRFARRGSVHALWYGFLEQVDMLKPVVKGLMRRGRPVGLGHWWRYQRGFLQGLLLTPRLGFVDGAAMRRMTETRQLDA